MTSTEPTVLVGSMMDELESKERIEEKEKDKPTEKDKPMEKEQPKEEKKPEKPEQPQNIEKLRAQWKENLVPDMDGMFSIYLPRRSPFISAEDVQKVFKEFGEIKKIKVFACNFFVKYANQDEALAALEKHHREFFTKVASYDGNKSKNFCSALKKRLEEDNRGIFTICVEKNGRSMSEVLAIFEKYGRTYLPHELSQCVFVRYKSRQDVEKAIDAEFSKHRITVPMIRPEYRKVPGKSCGDSPVSPVNSSSSIPSQLGDYKGFQGAAGAAGAGGAAGGGGDVGGDTFPNLTRMDNRPTNRLLSKMSTPFSPPGCQRGGGDLRSPPPPPDTTSVSGAVTMAMIRACVQEQMQLQQQMERSSISSEDLTDVSFSNIFPIRYSFIGSELDIKRDSPIKVIVALMQRPTPMHELQAMHAIVKQRFSPMLNFLRAYDMKLECLGGGAQAGGLGGGGAANLMASLVQIHSFVQKETQELSGDPALLCDVHAMNRAVMKLTSPSHTLSASISDDQHALTLNLWQQWLQALHIGVIECGTASCLRCTSMSQVGEVSTLTGRPSFAVYRGDPVSNPSSFDVMQALMDLDVEPVIVIDVFPPVAPPPQPTTSTTADNESSIPCPSIIFSDFLDLPNPDLDPPPAFSATGVWDKQLPGHLHHLLAVLQSQHSRWEQQKMAAAGNLARGNLGNKMAAGGNMGNKMAAAGNIGNMGNKMAEGGNKTNLQFTGGHNNNNNNSNSTEEFQAYGLIVLKQHDVYVTCLTASSRYLVALKEQRPQHRAGSNPGSTPTNQASLVVSRWKLDFALSNHRHALAMFIAMLM